MKTRGAKVLNIILIVFLGTTAFIHVPIFLDPSHSPLYFYLQCIQCIIFSVFIFLNGIRLYHFDRIDILVLLYLILGSLSIYIHSNNSESYLEWHRILFFATSFWFFKSILSSLPDIKKSLITGFILGGLFYSLFGWFEFIHLYDKDHHHMGLYGISANIGHKNLLAIYLSLCLPLIYFLYKNSDSRIKKLFLTLSGLNISLLTIVSMSRVGYLGIFIFYSYILYLNAKKGLRISTIIGLSFFFIVLSIFAMSTNYGQRIFKRSFSILIQKETRDENNQSIRERKALWTKTIELIKDHPLKGLGLGQWKFHIGSKNINKTRAKFGNIMFQRPHNDFLWIWSENGLLSLIIYLLLFFIPIYCLFRHRESLNTIHSCLLITFFIFFVQSNFDFPKERPILLYFFAFYLALYCTENKNDKWIKSIANSKFTIVFIVGSICSTFFFAKRLSAEFSLTKLQEARKNNELQTTLKLSKKIKSKGTEYDNTSTPIEFYKGEANFHLNNYFDARDNFLNSLKLHPNHLYTWSNLGGVYFQLENRDSAITCWEKALSISKDFAEPRINLSLEALRQNNYEKSIEYLRFDIENESVERYRIQLLEILRAHVLHLKPKELSRDIGYEWEHIVLDEKRLLWLYKTYSKGNLSFRREIENDINYSLKRK